MVRLFFSSLKIQCNSRSHRYHFGCVGLSEQTAEDISKQPFFQSPSPLTTASDVYICAPCTEKTGHRTVSEYLFHLLRLRVVQKHHVVYLWACIISRDETFICILLSAFASGIWYSQDTPRASSSHYLANCICVVPSELVLLS